MSHQLPDPDDVLAGEVYDLVSMAAAYWASGRLGFAERLYAGAVALLEGCDWIDSDRDGPRVERRRGAGR